MVPMDLVGNPGIFGPAVISQHGEIVTLEPKSFDVKVDLTGTLKIFDKWVVLLVGVVFLFTSVFISFGLERFGIKYENLRKCLWKCLATSLCQNETFVRRPSKRIIFAMLLILIGLLIAHYNAMFSTNLTIKITPPMVESLDDLLKSDLRPMFAKGIPITDVFRFSNDEPYKSVREKSDSFPGGMAGSMKGVNIETFNVIEEYLDKAGLCLYDLISEMGRIYSCNRNSITGREDIMKVSKEKFLSVLFSFLYKHGTENCVKANFNKG